MDIPNIYILNFTFNFYPNNVGLPSLKFVNKNFTLTSVEYSIKTLHLVLKNIIF